MVFFLVSTSLRLKWASSDYINKSFDHHVPISIREIAKHRLNRLHVHFHITADSRHSLNAAFCTDVILAGPQVSGKIEDAAPKT